MKTIPRALFGATIALGLSVLVGNAAFGQAAIRLESDVVLARRIPIAVPDAACEPGLETVAREITEALRYDLQFTELFSVLPASQYPDGFTGLTADPGALDFEQWRKTGVENVIHVYVRTEGGNLKAECRLFDAFTGTGVTGAALTTSREYPRFLAHKFSEDVVRMVEGEAGMATSELCFSAGKAGRKEIYVSDYDGANMRAITAHNSISILPVIGPKGRQIAYLSYKDRYPYLYVFNRDTGRSTPLSKRVGLNVSPTWSPDGERLAIVLSKDGNPEIYLINVDGTGLKRLTWDKNADTSPTFSPSGDMIAFVSDRWGFPQIFSMTVDGKNVKRLSFQGGRSYDPEWSPDGKYIAYVAERSGEGREIYVMNADGSNPRRLTDSYGSNESPSWSPDSRHIVFASTREGGSRLWTVHVETGSERPVPRLEQMCQGPTWGPRR